MKSSGFKAVALLGLVASVVCHTVYRLYFIDTVAGFLECAPLLKYLYYIVMAGASLVVLLKAFTAPLPEDPMSGGRVASQLIVIWVGIMAVALSVVMVTEVIALLPSDEVTMGSKVSHIVGVPLSLVGGLALVYAGYDYTNLSTRNKKASFALLGAAMQTYMLLYRFPEMLEVTTAPTQTLELFYLLSAALFMLFWARTLSGEATSRQNRLTYMAGSATAILGISYLAGELAMRFFLSDVLPVNQVPLLSMLMMASMSVMAFNFVIGSFPRRGLHRNGTAIPNE